MNRENEDLSETDPEISAAEAALYPHRAVQRGCRRTPRRALPRHIAGRIGRVLCPERIRNDAIATGAGALYW